MTCLAGVYAHIRIAKSTLARTLSSPRDWVPKQPAVHHSKAGSITGLLDQHKFGFVYNDTEARQRNVPSKGQ